MNLSNHDHGRQTVLQCLRVLFVGALSTAVVLVAGDNQGHHHASQNEVSPAKLVQVVRTATQRFTDVNAATNSSYKPMFGCVTGPEKGAMGVHYINGELVSDGEVGATKPEALIYEPTSSGMRLVGVEFIVDAATWNSRHTEPPTLEGQAFHLVTSPNRYGLAPFYELHVWAWRNNPNGAFVDWNTKVSCEGR